MLELIRELYPYLIQPLIITLISEVSCLVLMKQTSYKIYLLCFGMNIITNLSMNIALQYVPHYYLALVIFEVLVVIIEAFGYYLMKKNITKALFIAFICNAASLVIGVLIMWL